MGFKGFFSRGKKSRSDKTEKNEKEASDVIDSNNTLGLSISGRESMYDEEKLLNATLRQKTEVEKNKDKNINGYYLFKINQAKNSIDNLPQEISSLLFSIRDTHFCAEDILNITNKLVNEAILYIKATFPSDGVCCKKADTSSLPPYHDGSDEPPERHETLLAALETMKAELTENLLKEENKKKMVHALRSKVSDRIKLFLKGAEKLREVTSNSQKQLAKVEAKRETGEERRREGTHKKGKSKPSTDTIEESAEPPILHKSAEEVLYQISQLKTLADTRFEPSFGGFILYLLTVAGDLSVLFEGGQFLYNVLPTTRTPEGRAVSHVSHAGGSTLEPAANKKKSKTKDHLTEMIELSDAMSGKMNDFIVRIKLVIELYTSVVIHIREVEGILNDQRNDTLSVPSNGSMPNMNQSLSMSLNGRRASNYEYIVSPKMEADLKEYEIVIGRMDTATHKKYYQTAMEDKVVKLLRAVQQQSESMANKSKETLLKGSTKVLDAVEEKLTPQRTTAGAELAAEVAPSNNKEMPSYANTAADENDYSAVSEVRLMGKSRNSPSPSPLISKLRQFTTRTLSMSEDTKVSAENTFVLSMYNFIELDVQFFCSVLTNLTEVQIE
ncbi:hypothetical protein AGDE_16768 [Angomonas deanei]|nr:hypothetical protein AGDE_16768 [Angomonas deanei]|eukprot:EPY16245.1 hypothetical protein AGDE_16768 [Angomonas deanei]